MCLKQKEEDTCLGTALTVADAAYVFSSSQLSTPEEGDTLTCVANVGSHFAFLSYTQASIARYVTKSWDSVKCLILYSISNFREDHFLL